MEEAQEKLLFTFGKLFGTITRDCCPECDSDEWERYEEWTKSYKEYSDGTVIQTDEDYQFTVWQCGECGHEQD